MNITISERTTYQNYNLIMVLNVCIDGATPEEHMRSKILDAKCKLPTTQNKLY